MIRQIIVTTITDQMKKISAANGFYSEAGKNVFEWQDRKLDKDEYPAIIIRDVSKNSVDKNPLSEHTLKVEIDIAISEGDQTPWNMREATSDVIKAFGSVEEELNYTCRCTGDDFIVKTKDTTYGGVRVEFEVDYQSARWEQ